MANRRGKRQREPERSVVAAGGAAWAALWRQWRWATLVVSLAGILAFGRSLLNEFTYDEGLVIVQADPYLQSGSLSALASKRYFAASREGTYRPVVTLTYMLDRAVSAQPAVFKGQSLLWHIACALLVIALAGRLLPEAHRRLALVAGLLFVLHPVTTETVDNASFREDALATFFTLAALLAMLSQRRRAALALYAVALLSKESAVVMPALLLGARLLRVGAAPLASDAAGSRATDTRPAAAPSLRTLARELVPFGVLTALYLAIRFGPMNTPGAYASFPGDSRAATLLGMPAVFAHYLRLLVAPWPLCADYSGYFNFGGQTVAGVAGPLLLLGAFAGAMVLAFRRGHRALAFALGWFLVALLPVANIIPIPVPAAERFLYLPLVGIALAVAWLAAWVVEHWPGVARPLAGAGCAVALLFAVLINLRHRDWRNNDALWTATAAANPRSCGAHSAIGGMKLREGINTRTRAPLEEGVRREQLALQLCPPDKDPGRGAVILTRLGAAHAVLNQVAPARDALEHAVRLSPRDPLATVWLGYIRFLAGDKRAASDLLKHAVIDLGPPNAMVAEVAQQYMDKL